MIFTSQEHQTTLE